jgi:hypothetical protein
MKKILTLVAICLFAAFYSCSSDGDGGSSSGTGQITAKIDGTPWASMTGGAVASVTQVDADNMSGMVLQIVGMKMDQSSISLQFPITTLAVGTYTFSGFDSEGLVSYLTPAFDDYNSDEDGGNFTLEITDVNLDSGKISGTFSGTLVDFDGTGTVSITDGHINNVLIVGSSFYSNGTMTMTRNGGSPFTMDDNQDDGKYLMLSENTAVNELNLIGYNMTVTTDSGVYGVTFPKDIDPGTYDIEEGTDYEAAVGTDDDHEYHATGTLTITSHNGNNVIGTFSFNATGAGLPNVTVTNGSFNVTHH